MPQSELHPDRDLLVTGTDAVKICDPVDNVEKIHKLWQEKLGLIEREDLSESLPVQIGKACEPVIAKILGRRHGAPLSQRGAFHKHPRLPFSVTLDGELDGTLYEIKTCNPFSTEAEIAARYAPQIAMQLMCTGANRAILAALQGFTLRELEIKITPPYSEQVTERCLAFHECLITMTPPGTLALFNEPPPVPPELWRTIDLEHTDPLPNWAADMIAALTLWRNTKAAADEHAESKVTIKGLIPDDVGKIVHRDEIIRRAKNGAVTIRIKDNT